MANWYVYSAAAGGGTGADWANAYTTLGAAMTAKAAGDTFYVAHDHAETGAVALTITSPGTEALPCRVYCVNRAGSVPPVAADLRTTATITTTGTSALITAGTVSECYGIIFSATTGGSGANMTIGQTAGRLWRCTSCSFRTGGTNSTIRIIPGATVWENCTLQFAGAGQGLQLSSTTRFIWKNTPNAIGGAIMPNALFATIGQSFAFVEGCDFSALTSGKFLVSVTAVGGTAVFKNCKLSTTATIFTGAGGLGGGEVTLIGCDSGDTTYRNEKYNFMGTQTTETTIVLTGGASDGVTPVSWKIVTTADVEKDAPFECLPIAIWNDTAGSPKTITLQGIWGGGAVPNNDDIWMDVEYLGTSGFPLVSKATSGRATPLTAGSAIPAGAGTWGGSTTKFAMSVTVTPQEKGPFTIYIKAGAISSTFYVDPKPVIT